MTCRSGRYSQVRERRRTESERERKLVCVVDVWVHLSLSLSLSLHFLLLQDSLSLSLSVSSLQYLFSCLNVPQGDQRSGVVVPIMQVDVRVAGVVDEGDEREEAGALEA